MIEVDALSKTFYVHRKAPGLWGSVRSLFRREQVAKDAVRDATFRVGEGEIIGLIGANGAGKTTLVKMLAGIIHPTSGDARVLGFRPWERDNRFRRQIALIMGQKNQLWWDLPAADCFILLKEIYQIPDDRFAASLDYLVAVLDVRDQLNVQIRRLSLGERMKMELIAALLHTPRIVYLDEPTIGLDITAQRAIRTFILEYREEHRPAMILTSHYMEDIERLCERILIIREGDLVYDGPLRDVVERFAQHKVVTARFDEENGFSATGLDLAGLGTVVERTDALVRLQVARGEVAATASALLARFPVADLSIEEEDVASIVERIMRAKGATA
jgi:ABC-2 type transport system ATP-binding protein